MRGLALTSPPVVIRKNDFRLKESLTWIFACLFAPRVEITTSKAGTFLTGQEARLFDSAHWRAHVFGASAFQRVLKCSLSWAEIQPLN